MAVATVRMQSRALERPVHYIALLPEVEEAQPGPYPVLVQLHGYWDDYTAWLYKSNLLRYVQNLPLIVILPNGENSFWSNLGQPLNYEDFVVHDLWEHVNNNFAVKPGSKWAIGGLSMGGFGAIHLGLKHPDKYCSIFAHSSAIPAPGSEGRIWNNPIWSQEHRARLRADMNCYKLAEEIDRRKLPRLGFDCGTADFLIEENRSFHAHLEKIGLPHSYAEFPGEHTWDYWDEHVPTALKQHCEVLGIEPKPKQD